MFRILPEKETNALQRKCFGTVIIISLTKIEKLVKDSINVTLEEDFLLVLI